MNKELDNLKAENARLKEELATYGATGVCEVCSDKANKLADKYLGCLQEIKAIATRAFAVRDDDCGNANRFTEILDLIAKTESED